MTSDSPKGPVLVSPAVKETASEDGGVLLDVEQGICFSLNSVGLRIWELLKQGDSHEQIAEQLEKDYAVPRAQLLEDIRTFTHELELRKLLLNKNDRNSGDDKQGLLNWLWRRFHSA